MAPLVKMAGGRPGLRPKWQPPESNMDDKNKKIHAIKLSRTNIFLSVHLSHHLLDRDLNKTPRYTVVVAKQCFASFFTSRMCILWLRTLRSLRATVNPDSPVWWVSTKCLWCVNASVLWEVCVQSFVQTLVSFKGTWAFVDLCFSAFKRHKRFACVQSSLEALVSSRCSSHLLLSRVGVSR